MTVITHGPAVDQHMCQMTLMLPQVNNYFMYVALKYIFAGAQINTCRTSLIKVSCTIVSDHLLHFL